MSEITPPEAFTRFQDWLSAALRARGITQMALAKQCGVTRQAVTAWLRGGPISPAALEKISQWSGVQYMSLRYLVDEMPQPGSRQARDSVLARDPKVTRISALLETMAGDDEKLNLLESIVQSFVDQALTERSRMPKKNGSGKAEE